MFIFFNAVYCLVLVMELLSFMIYTTLLVFHTVHIQKYAMLVEETEIDTNTLWKQFSGTHWTLACLCPVVWISCSKCGIQTQ